MGRSVGFIVGPSVVGLVGGDNLGTGVLVGRSVGFIVGLSVVGLVGGDKVVHSMYGGESSGKLSHTVSTIQS